MSAGKYLKLDEENLAGDFAEMTEEFVENTF